jgi:uncharacterized membrane protein YtjA (UPF0391 family)
MSACQLHFLNESSPDLIRGPSYLPGKLDPGSEAGKGRGWIEAQSFTFRSEPTGDFWKMLGLLITLIVIALIAGALGFTGIAAGAAFLAKIIFAVMLIGIVIILVMAMLGMAILF